MQLSLDSFSLKPFTKALTCLSKYGDDLSIYATRDTLSLSATNSSMSAYCRFKFSRQFFSKYSVGPNRVDAEDAEDAVSVTGQLLTKSLLSILKHRTVEKTVDRCELSIIEGSAHHDSSDEDQDGLESKLIVRLHCQHGVVKTHRLLLLTPTSLMAPGIPDATNESRLNIGPKAVKDMIEHFPLARGAKSDPQLIWNFGDSEVELKSLESSVDTKGKIQLSTELTISADEFDIYELYSTPTTIAFHLREFNASIAYAESMALSLDLRFTDPSAPLFIDVEGDNSETLFVISTSQVHGCASGSGSGSKSNSGPRQETPVGKKRDRDEEDPNSSGNGRLKKPAKVVQRSDPASLSREESSYRSQSSRVLGSMPPPPPPSFPVVRASRSSMAPPPRPNAREPLFLPSSSQLSTADEEVIRASGLGIENMNAYELEAMLEGDGEEVAFDFTSQRSTTAHEHHRELEEDQHDDGPGQTGIDSFELQDDELALTQTQRSDDGPNAFRPLFED